MAEPRVFELATITPWIVFGVIAALAFFLVIRGLQRRKNRRALLALFEHQHDLAGSTRVVDGVTQYTASGQTGGLRIWIDSGASRSERRGLSYRTRVRVEGDRDLGEVLSLRRGGGRFDLSDATALPEHVFEDGAFEARFRTLAMSAELAEGVLTPEVRKRLLGPDEPGFLAFKAAGREVSITFGWSMAWGLSPAAHKLALAAIEILRQVATGSGDDIRQADGQ